MPVRPPSRSEAIFRRSSQRCGRSCPKCGSLTCTTNATPARWANFQREKKANQLIKDCIAKGDNLDYIDTFDATMGDDGKPRVELFVKDHLHFNRRRLQPPGSSGTGTIRKKLRPRPPHLLPPARSADRQSRCERRPSKTCRHRSPKSPRLCGAGPESHHLACSDSRWHGISRFGAYDFHDYNAAFDFRSRGHIAQQVRSAAVWAKYAHRERQPRFSLRSCPHGLRPGPAPESGPKPAPRQPLVLAELMLLFHWPAVFTMGTADHPECRAAHARQPPDENGDDRRVQEGC